MRLDVWSLRCPKRRAREEGHSEIDSLLFRGLMQPTETNEVKGDLAIDWEISKDLLEYQFTLREDAFWQDGQRLTAYDVKFTLDKIRDPSINSPSQSEFRHAFGSLTADTVKDIDNPLVDFVLEVSQENILFV